VQLIIVRAANVMSFVFWSGGADYYFDNCFLVKNISEVQTSLSACPIQDGGLNYCSDKIMPIATPTPDLSCFSFDTAFKDIAKRPCREGGCEWDQSIFLKFIKTSANSKNNLKDPGPLYSKNVFERLNNSTCNLIESSYQRSKNIMAGSSLFKYREVAHRCRLQSREDCIKIEFLKKNLAEVGR
jgi:hypothetical protein